MTAMTTARAPLAHGTTTVQLALGDEWFTLCERSLLTPGRGWRRSSRTAGEVAVFLDRAGRVYAIDNRDPFTGAYVLSAA